MTYFGPEIRALWPRWKAEGALGQRDSAVDRVSGQHHADGRAPVLVERALFCLLCAMLFALPRLLGWIFKAAFVSKAIGPDAAGDGCDFAARSAVRNRFNVLAGVGALVIDWWSSSDRPLDSWDVADPDRDFCGDRIDRAPGSVFRGPARLAWSESLYRLASSECRADFAPACSRPIWALESRLLGAIIGVNANQFSYRGRKRCLHLIKPQRCCKNVQGRQLSVWRRRPGPCRSRDRLSGQAPVLVRDTFPGSETFVQTIRDSAAAAGAPLIGEVDGAGPNAPREDLFRIADSLKDLDPDVMVSFGGGSTIDATKAGEVLRTLGGGIDDYFGTGQVTQALADSGKTLTPHVAIQTAASSGAHLTKYSNITDVSTGQKKLIVDEAVVPARPVFDYEVTYGAPTSLTADGALDGIAHWLEVLLGAVGKPFYEQVEPVARTGIGLVVNYLPKAIADPTDEEARSALCLATDLGAYAIMIGGTNGGHLTSFSLVDVTSHGRACAMTNPYYTVFFAPAIEPALRMLGRGLCQGRADRGRFEQPERARAGRGRRRGHV